MHCYVVLSNVFSYFEIYKVLYLSSLTSQTHWLGMFVFNLYHYAINNDYSYIM